MLCEIMPHFEAQRETNKRLLEVLEEVKSLKSEVRKSNPCLQQEDLDGIVTEPKERGREQNTQMLSEICCLGSLILSYHLPSDGLSSGI